MASIKQNKVLLDIVFKLNDLVLKMLEVLMKIAPLGIFCLIAKTFSSQESIHFRTFKIFYWGCNCFIYSSFCSLSSVSKINSKSKHNKFFSGLKQALLFAFSTSKAYHTHNT